MLRYALLALALIVGVPLVIGLVLSLFAVLLGLLITLLVVLALASAVGIPVWQMSHRHLKRRGARTRQHPIERLQSLYAEGKIDLFEFERRVSHLVSIEP
jgi:uncharacterized membrane protein